MKRGRILERIAKRSLLICTYTPISEAYHEPENTLIAHLAPIDKSFEQYVTCS